MYVTVRHSVLWGKLVWKRRRKGACDEIKRFFHASNAREKSLRETISDYGVVSLVNDPAMAVQEHEGESDKDNSGNPMRKHAWDKCVRESCHECVCDKKTDSYYHTSNARLERSS